MLADAYSFALRPQVGHTRARSIVQQAVNTVMAEGVSLTEAHLAQPDLPQLAEGEYLGRANEMIDGVLAELWRTLGRKTDE